MGSRTMSGLEIQCDSVSLGHAVVEGMALKMPFSAVLPTAQGRNINLFYAYGVTNE